MQLPWVSRGSIANNGTCCAKSLRIERSSMTHLKSGRQMHVGHSPISSQVALTLRHSRSVFRTLCNGARSVNCPLMARPVQNMFHSCSGANVLGPSHAFNRTRRYRSSIWRPSVAARRLLSSH